MKREIVITSDGSSTIHLPDWNENYHSTHGAIQEAKHVFIAKGLAAISLPEISILEIGFGTGLNAITTLERNETLNKNIDYTGVEAFPVSTSDFSQLKYSNLELRESVLPYLDKIHILWVEDEPFSFFAFVKFAIASS